MSRKRSWLWCQSLRSPDVAACPLLRLLGDCYRVKLVEIVKIPPTQPSIFVSIDGPSATGSLKLHPGSLGRPRTALAPSRSSPSSS